MDSQHAPIPASRETPALEVRGLKIGYPLASPPVALCGTLGFALPKGMLTAIIGINGVGKSTLLRTLAGMQPALEGSIGLLGTDSEHLGASERARLQSIVLTDPPASRNLTVMELVSLGRHPYTNWLGKLTPGDLSHISDAIQRMELTGLRDRPCHTLSDGQLQRVQIARALAQDTPLILLDEPTTHLDLYHKVRILKGLRSIAHETGKSVLLTTHEIDLAIQLSDRMLILREDGGVFGDPCELIEAGAFRALFPEETVRFDDSAGVFRVNK